MCLEKERAAAHALWTALSPGTAAFVPEPAAGHPHGYLTRAQTSAVSCHSWQPALDALQPRDVCVYETISTCTLKCPW